MKPNAVDRRGAQPGQRPGAPPAASRGAKAATGSSANQPLAKREPKAIETLLSRATGQRGSPAGKGRGFPAAKGKDKRRAVSNGLQSRRRSARGHKAA